jgi:hypothetical protein
MIARFTWIRKFLVVCAVLSVGVSGSLGSAGTALAQGLSPSAAACAKTNNLVGAGAPKQATLVERDPATPPPSCPSGLVALWSLDETSGTTFVDSANGHDGTCTDGCPVSATGVVSNALTFGAATTVTVAANTAFDFALADSFTLEAWLKPAATCTNAEPVIGRSSVGGTDFQWWLGCETGKAEFIVKDQNSILFAALGTSSVVDGNFHHLVGVRDASTNELRLYVDGVLETTTPSTNYTANFGTGTPIYLGWFKAANKYHFTGVVDEIAVYNRVVTAQEITDHHTNGLAGHGICDVVVAPPPSHFLYLPLVMK